MLEPHIAGLSPVAFRMRAAKALASRWLSNGSRVSCGALKKKVSFNTLRAPPAASAC